MRMNALRLKKFIMVSAAAAIILAVAAFMMYAGWFSADAASPAAKARITASGGTYLRSSYSTSSQIKAVLSQGTTFTVTSEKFTTKTNRAAKYRWYYSSSKRGYVRSDLMSVYSYDKMTGKTSASVYARYGAGTGFDKKTLLTSGKSVSVVLNAYDSSGSKWYKIYYDGGYYYVMAKYVVMTSTTTSNVATTQSNTAKTVKALSRAYTYGTVTASTGTTVRKSYSSSSYSLGKINKGTVCNLSSVKFTSSRDRSASSLWYYSPTYGGYIRSDAVSPTYISQTGYTTAELSVRVGAGTDWSRKATLSKGTKVYKVMNAYDTSDSKWYMIKYDGGYYYVYAAYVTFTSSGGGSNSNDATTVSAYAQSLMNAGFPKNYATRLATLHSKHPSWIFKPVQTGLNWSDAAARMTANPGANTIYTSYAPSYRSTLKGCYNYLSDSYKGKDGAYFVAASTKAVKYYMDPRNWLDETNIFMFEDHAYHPAYQTLSLVKKLVEPNSILYNNASYFIDAGSQNNISPAYLASKAYNELGSSSYMISGKYISYGGKSYRAYNVYNIGAYDSANGSAAYKGLVYAISGTTYGRRWTTLSKATIGGANFLARAFIANRQNVGYLEHFNVMNGLYRVGSNVYMTAVYAPKSVAYAVSNQYKDYGIFSKKIEFYIPIYKNMPDDTYSKPSTSWSKDNNMYLKTLRVSTTGGTTLYTPISSSSMNFGTSFSKTVSNSVSAISISASAASRTGASVSGTGTRSLRVGTNVFYVKCQSSSGYYSRTYKITITRSAS
jgi:beta-N-acetylglucosaminidase